MRFLEFYVLPLYGQMPVGLPLGSWCYLLGPVLVSARTTCICVPLILQQLSFLVDTAMTRLCNAPIRVPVATRGLLL